MTARPARAIPRAPPGATETALLILSAARPR